jgi:arylformamidase
MYSNGIGERARFIDLSHTIEDGLVTYKGLPAPIICDYLSRERSRSLYEAGTEFQIGKIEMVANTGTYIDVPFHRYADGKDLSDHKNALAIDASYFEGKEIRGKAILVHTAWDKNWNTESYFEDHPYLTEDAALYLQKCGAKLVGIDSMNIDNTKKGSRPVHSILLKSEILIVEHLCNLEEVPDEGFSFSAIPPKFKGVGTFPVRALAKLRR